MESLDVKVARLEERAEDLADDMREVKADVKQVLSEMATNRGRILGASAVMSLFGVAIWEGIKAKLGL